MDYTYAEIEKAVRGKLLVPTRRGKFAGDVSLDTRGIKKGDLFVALKGKNFDGHDFIEDAFSKGARLCIAEYRSSWKVRRKDADVIFVDDTLQALGRLAGFYRRQFDIPVVAITGSCGKTTTKDLAAHLIASTFSVLKSEGTENNFIGVPKTLLQLKDHKVAVVEIGTNRKGEIRHLSRLVKPTHAVLTLIGNAHLTGFRNVQGVKTEKLSIIEALDDGAAVIYNADDKNIVHPRFKKMKCVRVGFSKAYDFYADRVVLKEDGAEFRLNGKETIRTHLLGRHNVLNILLAAATAASVGVGTSRLGEAIESFQPVKGRVRHQEIGGIHWIDDSYNSNPTSLKAALELFKAYPPKGRKILVLGDMLELGPRATLFHRDAGASIAGFAFDLVVTVGDMASKIAQGAVEGGFSPSKVKTFGSTQEAGSFLRGALKENDTVLLKGSRGMQMEKVLEYCSAK